MWKHRVDGGSLSGGRISLLLRIKWVCMREKARDVFCRRELLASAAFHSLPHLFSICSLTVKLVTVKQTFLYRYAFFLLLPFCLVLGWSKGFTHVAKRKASGWPCWCTLETLRLRDQVSCHVQTLRFCMVTEIVQSNLQAHAVWCSQHRQTGGNSLLCNLRKHFQWSFLLCLFLLLFLQYGASLPFISRDRVPVHAIWASLYVVWSQALSTTIWLKKGTTDWPHFLFSAVGTYDHKPLSTNDFLRA